MITLWELACVEGIAAVCLAAVIYSRGEPARMIGKLAWLTLTLQLGKAIKLATEIRERAENAKAERLREKRRNKWHGQS